MSVRLNVLLIQSARMSGLQAGISAELAFQMMGVPGLDLSIVTSLKADEASDTDRLLLSSLQNDLAVLDWRDPGEVADALGQIGVNGARAPHRLDPSAPAASPGSRRLYLVDLRRGDPPAAVVEAMRTLLSDRRVVAVPLSLAGISKPSSTAAAVNAPSVPPVSNSPPASSAPPAPGAAPRADAVQPAAAEPPDSPPDSPAAEPQSHRGSGPASRPDERALDALVDGVNDVDW